MLAGDGWIGGELAIVCNGGHFLGDRSLEYVAFVAGSGDAAQSKEAPIPPPAAISPNPGIF